MGELSTAILRTQFERLRNVDRFFYTGDDFFDDPFVNSLIDLENHTLSQVIELNTGMSMQSNVFFVLPEPGSWLLIVKCLAAARMPRSRKQGRQRPVSAERHKNITLSPALWKVGSESWQYPMKQRLGPFVIVYETTPTL